MGVWGVKAFDNDAANDWAYDLEKTRDLSLVIAAFAELDSAADDYIDADIGSNALAACEVLARLQGNPGYQNAYTEKVDDWVKEHKLVVPAALVAKAHLAIDLVLSEQSELFQLWSEGDNSEWLEAVGGLRTRLDV